MKTQKFKILTALVALGPAAVAVPAAGTTGPQLLARADALRAAGLQRGDDRLLERAAELTKQAQGRTYTAGGRPAALDDAPLRGAVQPLERPDVPIQKDRPWRCRLVFRGAEPAFVYARTSSHSAIELDVSRPNGQLVCRTLARSGRALCGWRPRTTDAYTIEVRLQASPADDLAVFVN